MAKKEFDLDNLWNLGKRLGGQTDSRSDASPAGSGSRSNDIETDWEDDSSLTVGGDLTEGGGSDAFEGTEAAGDGDAEDLPEENTIRITMLGVSMSGKTSFLSGVYQTMMVDSFQGLSLVSSVGGEEDYEMISEIADIALINRDGFEFPAGTDRTTVFPLMLQKGSRDICRFEFTDYRGGDIEEILKKHSEYMESARDIRNRLVKSDAILIFADAVELSLGSSRVHWQAAVKATKINPMFRALVNEMGDRPLTVLIVLSKTDDPTIPEYMKVNDFAVLVDRAVEAFHAVFEIVDSNYERGWSFGVVPVSTVGEGNSETTTQLNAAGQKTRVSRVKDGCVPEPFNIGETMVYTIACILNQRRMQKMAEKEALSKSFADQGRKNTTVGNLLALMTKEELPRDKAMSALSRLEKKQEEITGIEDDIIEIALNTGAVHVIQNRRDHLNGD